MFPTIVLGLSLDWQCGCFDSYDVLPDSLRTASLCFWFRGRFSKHGAWIGLGLAIQMVSFMIGFQRLCLDWPWTGNPNVLIHIMFYEVPWGPRTLISQSGPRKTNKSNALCMKELLILPSPVKKVYPDIKSVTLSHQGQQQNKIIKWTPPPNVLNIIFFGPWLPAAAPAHIWNIDGRTSLNDCRPMLKNLGYLFSRHCGLKNSPALGICTLRAPSAHVGSRPMAYPN